MKGNKKSYGLFIEFTKSIFPEDIKKQRELEGFECIDFAFKIGAELFQFSQEELINLIKSNPEKK